LKDKEDGTTTKRVGIKLLDKGVAREGCGIFSKEGEKIGHLTSGGFSPTLQEAIGQGYVAVTEADAGTIVFIDVRGKHLKAEVAEMPFVTPKVKSAKAA